MIQTYLKIGDKVDFMWTHSDEESHLADFGTVYNVFDDYVVVRPYRSRKLLQCKHNELQLKEKYNNVQLKKTKYSIKPWQHRN